MGKKTERKMILVEIINTFLLNGGKEFVILLKGSDSTEERTLPISIGQLEAQSIALQLNNIPFPRPLTHDLIKELIDKLEGSVEKSEIHQLKDDTFFATIHVTIGSTTISIDARPSDAIALALRFKAPVFVAEAVMNEAGVVIPDTETLQEGDTLEISHEQEPAGESAVLEVLRKRLNEAITLERYEEAAVLRDKINKLTRIN